MVTAMIFNVLAGALVRANINPVSVSSMRYYEQEIIGSGLPYQTLSDTALDVATGYVTSEAWQTRLAGWGDGYAGMLEDTILQGVAQRQNPRVIARAIRQYTEGMPTHASDNLMRTLQLTAYREAEVAQVMANPGLIVKKYRIATLDNTTCLTCVALHGKEMEVNERVDDHYNGRCSAVYQIEGQDPPAIQSGDEWFASLSPERQAQQASFRRSPGKFNAYQDGVPLSAFVGEHQDPVFGHQVIEQSMTRALGTDQYYMRNQGA